MTDSDWYRQLARQAVGGEVNFWRPGGGRRFAAISSGEPFFFKTHHPHNRVVGGGFYSGFAALHLSEAWELFGQDNGARTLPEMRLRVGGYRQQPLGVRDDPQIGCVLIRDVRFFPVEDTVDPPPQFAPNVVQGKTYDLSDARWAPYFHDLLRRLLGTDTDLTLDLAEPWHRDGPVYGDLRLAPQRLGQQAFQAVSLTRTSGGARSPATRSGPCCKPRTSGRCPPAVSTVSTTGCCCGPTSTPCTTAATSASTHTTACWSARGFARSSATVSSSTARRGKPSHCPNAVPTGPTRSTSNGTSTPSFNREGRRRRLRPRCAGGFLILCGFDWSILV